MNWADGQGIPQADELFEIVYRYRFYLQDDNAYKNRLDYLATFCKVVMTIDSTPYGIFFPEERVLLLNGEKGKGRLTKNAEKANHRYYIDEQGRIYATECLNNGKVLHVTFFYYLESRVEFVQYNLLTKVINDVGVIQHFSPTKFSFTYGYVDYTYLTNGGGICYLQKKEVEENGGQVTISTLRTCLDLKDCGKSKIWKKLFETTQTLPRTEAYPEKKGGRKVKSTAKDFEEVVYNKIKQTIEGWDESDIYAISFFVENNESNCFQDYCNLSTFYISYNTESNCDGAGRYDEERWNYAFWLQNEVTIVDTENQDGMMDLLLEWYKKQNVQNIGEEEGDLYDRFFRYIGKGPNGHYQLLMLAANTAKRIQEEGLLKTKFGKDIPIVVHGLEYAWYDIEATKVANPQGQAKDFLKATKNW